ncbi:L-histidine N(alpha)-methyltransferase [Alteromonas sp. ASW11-130]|uniref:L-histidine N(alpha)-methyltransferase n=1 Tax=Alteromonas sp. ASW11-130 TaxID=3015775 RepID=UPI002241F81E|nr:L-histidine N(alpha)-methyltransferase [Alteromonas sp. ASW11-130]MCW8092349.1 L-histidine N(alpha)-methyltransferase [Alteromonas sp. ASW11-130]
MKSQALQPNPIIEFYDLHPPMGDIKSDVISGLSSTPKALSPKYFYDQKGSQLFDQICELPEYYVTRTEIDLLEQHGEEIASLIGKDSILMELGSGSSLKIRTLLSALKPKAYVAMDISKEHLINAATVLAEDYEWLEVHAVCVDFSLPWQLPMHLKGKRTAFFPGSSLGNFTPDAAIKLLNQIGHLVGKGGELIIGIDLKKDRSTLESAYNDAQGITATFNKNLLVRLNRELNANFNVEAFHHESIWNRAESRVEMHLVSDAEQTVSIDGKEFTLLEGESIHTENSYKYTLDEFTKLASRANFDSVKVWQDVNQLFSIHLLKFR